MVVKVEEGCCVLERLLSVGRILYCKSRQFDTAFTTSSL
jgi:hypothetical protein